MDQEAIAQFKSQLRGELIEPTDARYDDVRKVYNAMISRKPRLIALCADVADVIAAIHFARKNNLLVSIRGGGHNAGGLGICDDGLVIDLSRIKYVHVDPAARTVRVGGEHAFPVMGCGHSVRYSAIEPDTRCVLACIRELAIAADGPLFDHP